jgi:integrase
MARSFPTKKEAEAWARATEASLDRGQPQARTDTITVAKIIDEYEALRVKGARPIDPASNQSYMIQHLREDLGDVAVIDLTPDRFVAWAKYRHEQGAGGYTVNMELSQLGTMLRYTASFLRLTLPDVVGAARPMLHYLQLITGGPKRSRRATDDEIARILEWLDGREDPGDRIVAECVRVAAVTGLRRGELARIVWTDLDARGRAILVRARKHPRKIEATDEWVPLLGAAWDVVQRQPKDDALIFPVSREKISDTFGACCKALCIPDLHFHDLRRNATSALRELGFDQHERKKITGHRSDEVHERYIAITPESLHEKYAAAQGKRQRRQRRRSEPAHRP